VGLHRSGALLRFKNLVVAPAHRRRGVGAAILDAMTATAHADGLAAIGCFALWGETVPWYRANGFGDAVTQVGWDRTLTTQVPARLAGRRVHAYS
jgi:N-acetylglutamate synthase-like GNAT family acetyltransferase